jgi:hypothetical protein
MIKSNKGISSLVDKEWSKLIEVKERVSFIILTTLGYVTQLVEIIYKPLGQILE